MPTNDTAAEPATQDILDDAVAMDAIATLRRHGVSPADVRAIMVKLDSPPPGWERYRIVDDDGCQHTSENVRRVGPAVTSTANAWKIYAAEHGQRKRAGDSGAARVRAFVADSPGPFGAVPTADACRCSQGVARATLNRLATEGALMRLRPGHFTHPPAEGSP